MELGERKEGREALVPGLLSPERMTQTLRSIRYPIDGRAQRIMTAAFTEFIRRGVRGPRMSIIARRAGVSLATLRLYFPTPDALFREVIRSTVVRLIQHPHDAGPLRPGQPVVDQIRLFLQQTLRRLEEPDQLALLRLSLGELAEFPELAVFHATEMIGRTVSRLEAMLNEGIRRGEIHLCDVRTAARVIVAALMTYCLWLASPGIYGELVGPDRNRAEQGAIDVLVGVLGRNAP